MARTRIEETSNEQTQKVIADRLGEIADLLKTIATSLALNGAKAPEFSAFGLAPVRAFGGAESLAIAGGSVLAGASLSELYGLRALASKLTPEERDDIAEIVHEAVREYCRRGFANYLSLGLGAIFPREPLWLKSAQLIVAKLARAYSGYILGDDKTGPYYGKTVAEFERFLANDVMDYVEATTKKK